MSNTYSLICPDTKKQVWIGQGMGGMTTLYYRDPVIMETLRDFLRHHVNVPLLFVCNEGYDVSGYEDWPKYEEDPNEELDIQ